MIKTFKTERERAQLGKGSHGSSKYSHSQDRNEGLTYSAIG